MTRYDELKAEVNKEVSLTLSQGEHLSDDEVLNVIDDIILRLSPLIPVSINEKISIRREVFNRLRRLDVLQELLEDDTITEIMVNGVGDIFIERAGYLLNSGKRFESEERLLDIISMIASNVNRSINISSPIMDARLQDGSRVNVVIKPIAINGPILTIRRFPNKDIGVKELLEFQTVNEEILIFLEKLVRAGMNIIISGATGTGKTTFLNVLSNYIPKQERIITIEDSAELKISGIENLVRLEARSANIEGAKQVSIRDLIKSSLRMRPDRIIVGEVRGEEAIDMLQAFNVGQDGSISTIHANSAKDALFRLETMIMLNTDIPLAALRRQIASGVDIIIHIGRLRDKSRKLLEIREITGIRDGEIQTELKYEFVETSYEKGRVIGEFKKREMVKEKYKLLRAGIFDEI